MKKKLGIIFLIIIFICGCGKLSDEDKVYKDDVKILEDKEEFDTTFPFDIDVDVYKLTDYEVTYRMHLDNIKDGINNIKALVIHDRKTDDVYPSVGIFEDKIDLKKEKKKGILLVGYIDYKGNIEDFKATFKVMITYEENGKEVTKFYKKSF